MIVASIYATIGALVIGVPIGLFTAIFLAEIAPKKVARLISPAVQLLAGIPPFYMVYLDWHLSSLFYKIN